MLKFEPKQPSHDRCPSCGIRGTCVEPVTIVSLVVEPARARVGRTDGFRFCAEPTCDVAYYEPESGARIACSEVRVRIGQKVREAPHPICYCFDHSVEAIEAEVAATGTSKAALEIAAKCRQGLHRCRETNPQGSCCLGDVRRVVLAAQARRSDARASASSKGGDRGPEDCCVSGVAPATHAARPSRRGFWIAGAAVVSAVLSSACCWLPLLLIGFGASAAGLAGFFESYRPHLLAATGLLLAGGFYFVHLRKEKCGPGEVCAVPNPRLRRWNRGMLWVATALVVAFALFPNYVGLILDRGRSIGMPAGEAKRGAAYIESASGRGSRSVCLRVTGMTCAGCARGLEAQLSQLPGVAAAVVDYASGRASITLNPQGDVEPVLAAIAEQGFVGTETAGDAPCK